ncbi:MAG TPA: hypothetical protein VN682_17020 [Terriglobales bacterium]|nr:hypothetical protein [Terriglobales bacterium]
MAISDRNINFRAPERTHEQLSRLMDKFEAKRTWVIIKAIEHFFVFVFTPWILREVFQEWEAFSRKIVQNAATQQPKQLRLVFGESASPSFFVRFGGMRTPDDERPQPDTQEPIKAVGVVLATEAYTSPSFPARFRLLFAQGITRRAA